jgi:hypothetical protein
MNAHGVTPHHRRSFLPVSQLGFAFDVIAGDADTILADTSELPSLTIESIEADAAGPSSRPLAPGQ